MSHPPGAPQRPPGSAQRPPGAPRRPSGPGRRTRTTLPRSWKRWAAAAGLVLLWALFVYEVGSLLAGTILLMLVAAALGGLALALRFLGITRDHPWVQRLAERPWRDGREVWQLGLRHLPEAFIVTPAGSLLAPNAVELRMHPGDLDSLTAMMDIDLVNSSATEVYQDVIAEHGALLAGAGPAAVSVLGDPDVPIGRYRIRQGQPASLVPQAYAGHAGPGHAGPGYAGPGHASPGYAYSGQASSGQAARLFPPAGRTPPVPQLPPADAGSRVGRFRVPGYRDRTRPDPAAAHTVGIDGPTVTALAPVPLLRLVTRGHIAETRTSGAHAGRSEDTDLMLPAEPTVSRVHAEFTFADGHWHVTNTGRNGLTLNGVPLAGEHAIRDGDTIGWGMQPGAMVSRVEIGWDRPLPARPQG
jgi:FHA domain